MYALFTCNIHKTYDSMRFIGVARDIGKARKAAIALVKNDVIQLWEGYEPADIREMSYKEMQDLIDYFHIVEIEEILVDGTYYL